MKKLILFLLVFISYCSYSFGQGFTFDELVKMRSYTYPAFETYVHGKGYELEHLEYGERCTVFRKGEDVISYCHYYDDGYSYHNHVSIKFETSDKDEYEKVKAAVASELTYYRTKMRRTNSEHYLEHIYVNDVISVHLYDISYRDDDRPYYEIELLSVYAGGN